MRRSAAPSYRAAKRGKFVTPFLGSQGSSENDDSIKKSPNSSSAIRNSNLDKLTQEKQIGFKTEHSQFETITKDNDDGGITTISQNRNNLQNESKTSINYPAKSRPQFRSPCFINKQPSSQSPAAVSDKQETACSYFGVVWCKMSKKKHKKWDGDGVLMTRGRTAILKDLEGKEIAKGCGYKTSELETLKEGQTLFIGGKEIEVMSSVSSEDFMTGKCFHDTSSTTTQDSGSRPSSHTKVLKPFNNPGRLSSSPSISASQHKVNEKLKAETLTPRHNTEAPGALVMPRPNTTHQWENNQALQQVVDVVVDPHISQHLRPHQKEGVVFLYECALGLRNFNGNGAVLGDEMGLGKTLQCITLIWTLYKQNPYGSLPLCRRTLIITPGSLVKNWCSEFKKWLGNERIKVYPVTAEKRVKEFSISPIYPVLIISYEMFIRSMDEIKDIKFDLLICDEAHRLKNSFIKTTTLISGLKTKRRILLTGTPIQNDLKEFHSLIELCNPGVLGTQVLFRRVYEQPIVQGQQPNATSEEKLLGQTRATELNRLTSLFFLRRTAEINNQYLPSKVETVVFCRPSQLQLSLYRHLLASRQVRSCFIDSCGGSRHLICIAALKKICNHPRLVYQASEDATLETDDLEDEMSLYDGLLSVFPQGFDKQGLNLEMSGKLETLSKMLEDMFCSNQRVVVVSNYTQTLDVIQNLCVTREYRYLRLDGNTPTAKRQSIVDRFNSKHCNDFVFLLSSKAGGVGLNLIGASRLILYDIDWNPANDLQAMARVWRDGQRKKVHIYRLLTTGTIEEKIYQRQTTKQSLSGAVADARKEAKVEFTLDDIRDLFRLHENTFCATHDLLQCRCTETQDGNESTAVNLQSTPASVTRSCQLGVPSISDKKHTSIAELMDWQHLQFPLDDADYEDESLKCARDTITFVFSSENNNRS